MSGGAVSAEHNGDIRAWMTTKHGTIMTEKIVLFLRHFSIYMSPQSQRAMIAEDAPRINSAAGDRNGCLLPGRVFAVYPSAAERA